jgi:hypothetical protein
MSRKYEGSELPVRGWKDWLMGPSENTLNFEKSLKEQSLQRHIDLLEKDMELLCKQIKSRSTELNKYNVYLRDQLKKHGDWTWSEEKYPKPEYARKAREAFILFYETEFTPTFELLTSAIEEYKSSSGGGGRYKNVTQRYQQCIDKTKGEGQKYIESFMDLEEKSVQAINKKVKEQKEQENVTTNKKRVFGDFEQKYVKETPKKKKKSKSKSTPKSTPKMPKPKKTIKKTTQASPTLVPSLYFRDQVKKYLNKDMTTPVATKAEIKKAWHKLALQLHPDKLNGLSKPEQDEAVEIFNTITEEKDVLCGTVKIPVEDPTWKKAGKGKKTKKGKKSKKSKKGKKGKKGK